MNKQLIQSNELKEQYVLFWKSMEHDYHNTPLIILAVENGLDLVLEDLLKKDKNININETNKKGQSALMRAWNKNHQYNNYASLNCIKLLLKANADIHIQDTNKINTLMISLVFGPSQFTSLILNLGAVKGNLINHQDDMGWNPLFYAVNYAPDFIKPLLNLGADIKLKSNDGKTVFDISNKETLKILLDYEMEQLEKNLDTHTHKKHKIL